jgi:rhodanese-related sulfurtransferase
MAEQQVQAAAEVRIDAAEVKARRLSGEPVTLLDVRNDKAWAASPSKLPGAIRVPMRDWHIDPSWPKDQLTVAY